MRFRAAGGAARLHYGWIVAAISFLTLLVAAGIRSAPGVLLVPLEQTFGWSRATLALPISIGLLLYGLIGPFSAGFIERFGLRPIMLVALVMFPVGFGLTSVITAPWQLLLLWGVLIGCGTGMTAMVLPAAASSARRCENRFAAASTRSPRGERFRTFAARPVLAGNSSPNASSASPALTSVASSRSGVRGA